MLEEIFKLSKKVFQNEMHLGIKFNEYIHKQDYNRARVVTEGLRAIKPDDDDLLELDTLVTDLCIK